MTAGPFDLTEYDQAGLLFDLWLDSEGGFDGLWAGASSNGTEFAMLGWTGYTGSWEPLTVDLANIGSFDYTGEPAVWIIFAFESDESVSYGYEGAYIDNVRVTGTNAAANTAPVAVADSYQTDQDTPLVVPAPGVLANDTDADSDPLTASKVTNPSHGTVTLNANGGFTFTPAAGYHGTDSFTYRAYDGSAYSNTVSVTITIHEGEGPLPPVINVAGATRFETAVEASKLAYPGGAQTVVIATGRNWPDALGGSALAGVLNGPILLTEPGSLPPVVLAEIRRLGAVRAVILGGTAAVSTAVENALKAELGGAVERIAGTDRYDTANKVARRVITELGGAYSGTAFVATGGNFPDALAAAPLAAANGWPLYLSNPASGISGATRTAMAGVSDAIILGGTGAVPAAVQTNLGTWGFFTDRIAGTTRYDTAAKVAEYGVAYAGLGWNRVGIATGANYPDALAGGVLQGKVGSVMLLTPTERLCNEAGYALLDCRNEVTTVTFFGGTAAVSQTARNDVAAALAGTWKPPLPPPTGTDGIWLGYTSGISEPVISFNVKGNTITGTGSTLQFGASMIVVYPYNNVTMVTYIYEDIPIVNGQFSYASGNVTTIGGRKTVTGTIASNTHASGTASHQENSFGGFTGSLSYNWTADR
jgi:VCBS repeat-containing protein